MHSTRTIPSLSVFHVMYFKTTQCPIKNYTFCNQVKILPIRINIDFLCVRTLTTAARELNGNIFFSQRSLTIRADLISSVAAPNILYYNLTIK